MKNPKPRPIAIGLKPQTFKYLYRFILLMKRLIVFQVLFLSLSAFAQTSPKQNAKDGYEIKVTFKPFKNQYIYLGHYFGKQYPIDDSAMLNEKSEAVFKGAKKLPGGIYLIGYPNRAGFFEILVDQQQHFSVIADTATLRKGIQFLNSPDNTLFSAYQKSMQAKGKEIVDAQQKLKTAANAKDSAHWTAELVRLDKALNTYREDLIKNNPGHILSTLLVSMREPVMPDNLKKPQNKEDSLAAYLFFKDHFWDGVHFWDGRLAYTTFFEEKVDKYYNQLVAPHPDSVIKEIDRMMSFAVVNEQMTQLLLLKFVNRYLNQKYMWEDAVFVHLFEKYFAAKEYSWLTEKGRKTISDRAYSLMANIMGTPAADIELPDTTNKLVTLYSQTGTYTLLTFWDPTCGHCKEVLPKLDSFYNAKWKAGGLKLFAVAKETEGTKKDWMDFIRNNNLQEWTHVYYSKADEKTRVSAGIPGYSQLYDVMSFPTLYLLDKDKRIVAKKLSYEQIDEVLQLKMKGQ
jgi:thiol-disulfide isomerase/thioredoxin